MLKLFNLDKYCSGLPLITSPNFFIGNSKDQYDPNGLFSEKIFGPKNSKDWATKEAKIELKTKILNPVIFRLLNRLNRKLYLALTNNESFVINDDGSINFNPSNKTSGGIPYLINNWDRIRFDSKDSNSIRSKLIAYIQDPSNYDKIFVSTILVIPPKYRPIYQLPNIDELMYDELNDYYVRIIKKSTQNINLNNEDLFKAYTHSIQMEINNLYEFTRNKLGKKTGYIRGALLGKRTDFSGRAVATGDPNLPPDTIAIPLRMIVNIYRPFIIHYILNNPLSNWNELTKEFGGNMTIKTIDNVLDAIAKGYEIDKKLYNYIKRMSIEATKEKIVLMKRDPSLHRESWQAMRFVIWDGDTIKVSPSAVGLFNLDYDGDSIVGKLDLLLKIQPSIRLISMFLENKKNKIKIENNILSEVNILDLKDIEIEYELIE